MGLLLNTTKPMLQKGTQVKLLKEIKTKHGNIIPVGWTATIVFANPLLRLYDIECANIVLYGVNEDSVEEVKPRRSKEQPLTE